MTGCAGFIGFHVSCRLLERGDDVVGVDNLSHFYDDGLKAARLELLRQKSAFQFHQLDLGDLERVQQLFRDETFASVVHLAAQAGVRYSLQDPHLYIRSNLVGFTNLIEEARKRNCEHFVYASSSSVYGNNAKVPFSESDTVDHPISLYAATKKADELIAHVYAHLYGLPVTGLRFFTVYGPWGRPDMALFKFCKAILAGEPIEVFNHGRMQRDFTYIDDIVEGVVRVLDRPPSAEEGAPYRLLNIGNHEPVELMTMIHLLEEKLGKKAKIEYRPMQAGDVPRTYADIEAIGKVAGFRPHTPIATGIGRFVDWYRSFYRL